MKHDSDRVEDAPGNAREVVDWWILSKCPWAIDIDIEILGVNQCGGTVPGETRRENVRTRDGARVAWQR